VLHGIGHALTEAGSMAWQIAWSLILGFTLAAVVQAVVHLETVSRLLGGSDAKTIGSSSASGWERP